MQDTILLALVFAVLLALEWRYRLRSVRIGAALLAAMILECFGHPNLTVVRRASLGTPPAERVTQIWDDPLPEYQVGVYTTIDKFQEIWALVAFDHLLSVIVLLWLACSPAFRRTIRPPELEATDVSTRP